MRTHARAFAKVAQVALLALFAGAPGCGFALAQTAKVQPSGTTSVQIGMGGLVSQTDASRGGLDVDNLTSEVGVRAGLGRHVDLGVTGFLGMGALVDAKWSLLDQRRPEAIALRVGAGAGGPSDVAGQLGVLASYDVAASFVPYLGVLWTNHWIYGDTPQGRLPAGVTYAARKGYGDGVCELHLGFGAFNGPNQHGVFFEYALWLPMQNDPGDGFKFARSHFLMITARM